MRTLWRILSYLKPYRVTLFWAYVCLFLALGLQLALPYVLGRAIDDGITVGDMGFLWRASLIYLVLSILQGVFTFVRAYYMQKISEQVGTDMRDQLYAHLQRLPFSFFDRASTGQLMSRATDDINNIRGMLMMSLRTVMMIAGTLVAVAVILISLDWRLALVALAVYPPLVYFSYRFGVGVRPLFAQVQQQFGVMTSALQENVAGARVVRAFAQEQQEIARFETELADLFQRNLRAARMWSFSYSLMVLLSGVGIGAVIWYGGVRVLDGAMTIGTLVAFNRYLTLLAEPIRWLGFLVNRIARAIASGDRIFRTLDTEPDIADLPGAIELDPSRVRGEVKFEHVTFTYPGTTTPALVDVNLHIKPGQTIALVGPTGSGKSTIAQLLPRFYDVSDGRITLDGHDIRRLTLRSLRRQVATVAQDNFLFGISVRDNIAFGRPDAPLEDVIAAAKAAGAHGFISAMPEGYDTIVGERGVSLSGGQRQRIAIARALLAEPKVLILDDATSSVDSQTEASIQEALRAAQGGRTSIVIAQRLDSVRDADEIIVMDGGRIAQRGTHDELLAQDGFYRDLYNLQRQDRSAMQAQAANGATANGATRTAATIPADD